MNSFQLSLCKPLAAVWDPSIPGAVCLPSDVAQTSIYVTAAMTILTDVILSLIPLTFIVQLQRPLREKIAISFIMGLGLIASCASIYKTTLVKNYGVTGDTLVDGTSLTLCSFLEMQLGYVMIRFLILAPLPVVLTHSPLPESWLLAFRPSSSCSRRSSIASVSCRRRRTRTHRCSTQEQSITLAPPSRRRAGSSREYSRPMAVRRI